MRNGIEAGTELPEMNGRAMRFVEVATAVAGMLDAGTRESGSSEEDVRADAVPADGRLIPLLDLSPMELDSERIAEYFTAHGIEFSNQTLSFNGQGGDRLQLLVGPNLTSADFYFEGNDLLIVFARSENGNMSLRLNNGIFDGLYTSNDKGAPVIPSLV